MSNREDDSALHSFPHCLPHSCDLWRSRDNAHPEVAATVFAGQQPVLLHREVLRAIDFLEGSESIIRIEKELGRMGAAFCHLNKGTLGVPAEHGCGGGRGVRTEKMEEGWVERLFLCLGKRKSLYDTQRKDRVRLWWGPIWENMYVTLGGGCQVGETHDVTPVSTIFSATVFSPFRYASWSPSYTEKSKP